MEKRGLSDRDEEHGKGNDKALDWGGRRLVEIVDKRKKSSEELRLDKSEDILTSLEDGGDCIGSSVGTGDCPCYRSFLFCQLNFPFVREGAAEDGGSIFCTETP